MLLLSRPVKFNCYIKYVQQIFIRYTVYPETMYLSPKAARFYLQHNNKFSVAGHRSVITKHLTAFLSYLFLEEQYMLLETFQSSLSLVGPSPQTL